MAIGVPEHCEPQGAFLYWVSSTFHTCLPTPLALTTTALGSLSFLAWLFAQLPQIYKNYKIQSTAGLSIYFLIEWLLGDTTNLVGAILTKQASWQVLIASYYTFVDIILVAQFTYYTKRRSKSKRKGIDRAQLPRNDPGRTNPNSTVPDTKTAPQPISKHKNALGASGSRLESPSGSLNFAGFSMSPREKVLGKRYTRVPTQASAAGSPRTLLALAMVLAVLARAAPTQGSQSTISAQSEGGNNVELAGRCVSWISTVMYLGSRLPQIIKNARRRSTAGLSLSLFVAAFFGNLFYSTSLLTNPLAWGSYPPFGYYGWAGATGSDRREWILLALPFWLGAAGVLSLDGTIAVQFIIYGDGEQYSSKPVVNTPPVAIPNGDGEEPRGRPIAIRRVSGWMRGWIPSPSGMSWRTSSMTSQSSRFRFGSIAEDEQPPLSGEERPLLAEDRPRIPRDGLRAPSPLRNSYGGA